MTKRSLIIALVLGLTLRLIVGYFQYSGDLKNHLVWGSSFLTGPVGFYSLHFPGFNDPNYPPLAIILFAASNLLYSVFLGLVRQLNLAFQSFPSLLLPLFETENMKMLFLKLPGIFADIGIAYVLYLFSKKLKLLSLIPILFLFNPAFVYVSTVWGQTESVTAFFLIFSLYLAFSKHTFPSLLFFFLSVLTKQTALWFAPLFMLLWWKEFRSVDLFRGFLISAAVFFLFFIPFGLTPPQAISVYIATLSGSSALVTDAAWNLWHFIYGPGVADSTLLGPLSIRTISILLLFLSLLVILISLLRKYHSTRLLNALFLWSLLVFFLQTRVHERHLYFAPLFLLLTPFPAKNHLLDYILLSIYYYSNLYQSLGLPFIR